MDGQHGIDSQFGVDGDVRRESVDDRRCCRNDVVGGKRRQRSALRAEGLDFCLYFRPTPAALPEAADLGRRDSGCHRDANRGADHTHAVARAGAVHRRPGNANALLPRRGGLDTRRRERHSRRTARSEGHGCGVRDASGAASAHDGGVGDIRVESCEGDL